MTIAEINYHYGCHLALSMGNGKMAHDALEKCLNNAIKVNNCEWISKSAKELAAVSKHLKTKSSSTIIDKAAEYLKLAVEKTTHDVSFLKNRNHLRTNHNITS